MAFKEWAETEYAAPLILPINGKQYTIPELGHLDAIKLREEMVSIAIGNDPSMSNEEFLAMTLGPALEQMRADKVSEKAIVHAASVAHMFSIAGRQAAEELWDKGPNPEALAAAMRAAASAGSTTSLATPPQARTSSTKRAASTASTRSRRPAAKKSTGTRSSRSRA